MVVRDAVFPFDDQVKDLELGNTYVEICVA